MKEHVTKICDLYRESFKIAGISIYIFEDHSLALPVWGLYGSIFGKPLDLVTFDSHTDTHLAFRSYMHNMFGKEIVKEKLDVENKYIQELLKGVHYKINDFCFKEVCDLVVNHLKNTEQIITAYELGYLSSYTIINREGERRNNYERDDRLNGYNATYLSKESWNNLSPEMLSDRIALDFDLDFFGSLKDFDDEFITKVTPFIKKSKVITIAKEPKYFGYCKTDNTFTNDIALQTLLALIKESLV